MKCPNCQFDNRDDAKFCKSCGYKLEGIKPAPMPAGAVSSACPSCGAPLKPGAKFCSKCGTKISSSAAPAPAPAPVSQADPASFSVPGSIAAQNTAPASKTEALISEPEDRTEILMPEPAPQQPVAPQPIPQQPVIPQHAPQQPVIPQPVPQPVVPQPIPQQPVASRPVPQQPVIPQPVAPQPFQQSQGAAICSNCGTAMKPGAKFCPVCGNSNTAKEDSKSKNSKKPVKSEKQSKNKNALIITVGVILFLLLVGGGALFLTLNKSDKSGTQEGTIKDKIASIFNKGAEADSESDGEEPSDRADIEENENENVSAELEEKLAPIAEQITAGKEKMDSSDYAGATSDFTEALNAYADMAEDNADTVDPLAADAFDLYTQSILKQVEGWESQPPTAPLYQQIDLTLVGASEFASKLEKSGLTVSTDALDKNYAELPKRYKEKYIYAFNDLISGSEWSRTTAWMYMQDASSVRLVNTEDSNDPLTLRYAYALAWITQKEISEGKANGTLSDKDAIDTILAVAKNADYNPALIRELPFCYDAIGETNNSEIIKKACSDVYNYLATTENIFINAEELFVPAGRPSSSATISLTEFWYFNDFGDYSPASAEVQSKGLSPEGRNEVRKIFKEAINKLT